MPIGQAISLIKAAARSPLRRALQTGGDFFLAGMAGVIVYLAAMVAAALFVVSPPTDRHQAADRLIAQMPSLSDTAAEVRRLDALLPKLLALPGITKVEVICRPSSAVLPLQQAVNPQSKPAASPLSVVAMEVGAGGADAGSVLRQRLLAELPESTITTGDAFAAETRRPGYAAQGLLGVILGLLAATLCAGVGFSMGARLRHTSEAVSLLHALGADDAALIRVIVLNTARSALAGAAGGAAAAMITLVIFAGLAGGNFVGGAAGVLQSWAGWTLVVVLPVAAVSLVAVSAWLFARRAFAAMP